MTRILHLTDTHVLAAPDLVGGRVDTRVLVGRAVGRIAGILPKIAPVDLLLVTGDLTDLGRPGDYRAFRDLFAPLDLPLAVIPGNHDRREAMRAAFADLPGMPASGPIHWRRDLPGFRLIGLDTLVEGVSGGALSVEALAFLRDSLAGAPDRPAMVALHHPPFDTGIGFMDRIGLENAGAFAAALADHRAEIRVVCGHVHRHITGMAGRWPAVIAPSPAHAIAPDYRADAPVGYVDEPGGFLLHDWAGGFRATHIPVAPEEGPYPFRSTP